LIWYYARFKAGKQEMSKHLKLIILNPPSPPYYDVCRDWAGGFGIAWLRPKRGDYGQSDYPVLQPCLPFISSVLSREGYDFRVLDCQRLRLNKSQVLKEVAKENPDIVFSLLGLPSLRKDIELLNSVKKAVPNTFVVGMGTTCRVIPREVLLNGRVDVVLRSDYPYLSNLVGLIQAVRQGRQLKQVSGVSYVEDGKIVHTSESPEIDLSTIGPPSYDQFEPKGYHSFFTDLNGEKYEYIPILGSKGCPYGCFYCAYPLGFGKKATFRSPKDIAEEIELLHSNYGIRGFLFRDQSFVMNKKHALALCDEIKLRRLDIAWFCEARVDEVSREILQKMRDAGCKRIHYGVETGDPSLIGMGKPGVRLYTVRKAFRLTKEAGMWRTAHVILGWPDDTLETLRRTYEFVIGLDPDDVNWNTLTPYPGTKIYEIALKDSLILSKDLSKLTPDIGVMRTRNLSASQIAEAKKKMTRGYLRIKAQRMLLQFIIGKRKLPTSPRAIEDLVKQYIS
jgi:radical SAM superfamily enzyme YgiQ (UPF0313 family)